MTPVVPSSVPPDRQRKHRARDAGWWRMTSVACRWIAATARAWSPEWRDSLLYSMSAVFAAATAIAAGIPLYRQWGEMAVGPYAAAAVFMAVVAWRVGKHPKVEPGLGVHHRRWNVARIGACIVVLAGATVVPLALEVVWRAQGDASAHVQPEVLVVERAGVLADRGKDPYQVIDRNGHILIHQNKEPVYELYYPYLPGMVLFGFSRGSKVEARLTDARIQFLVFTVIISLIALSRLRPATDARVRALQVLTVLPTAALPLATGGDDMPVVALMLLGMVALQRRRPVIAGLALGAASSLKFTAWPLAILAAWVALDRRMRRAVGRYVLGFLVVAGPVVLPVAFRNPSAFVDNVIRFPLGLAGVASPAASPLPGHLFVTAFPGAHGVYVLVLVVGGLILLARRLIRKPPVDTAGVARLGGWVMLFGIMFAPATRVGYLVYSVNLFVWAWMLGRADDPAMVIDGTGVHEPEFGMDRTVPLPAL